MHIPYSKKTGFFTPTHRRSTRNTPTGPLSPRVSALNRDLTLVRHRPSAEARYWGALQGVAQFSYTAHQAHTAMIRQATEFNKYPGVVPIQAIRTPKNTPDIVRLSTDMPLGIRGSQFIDTLILGTQLPQGTTDSLFHINYETSPENVMFQVLAQDSFSRALRTSLKLQVLKELAIHPEFGALHLGPLDLVNEEILLYYSALCSGGMAKLSDVIADLRLQVQLNQMNEIAQAHLDSTASRPKPFEVQKFLAGIELEGLSRQEALEPTFDFQVPTERVTQKLEEDLRRIQRAVFIEPQKLNALRNVLEQKVYGKKGLKAAWKELCKAIPYLKSITPRSGLFWNAFEFDATKVPTDKFLLVGSGKDLESYFAMKPYYENGVKCFIKPGTSIKDLFAALLFTLSTVQFAQNVPADVQMLGLYCSYYRSPLPLAAGLRRHKAYSFTYAHMTEYAFANLFEAHGLSWQWLTKQHKDTARVLKKHGPLAGHVQQLQGINLNGPTINASVDLSFSLLGL